MARNKASNFGLDEIFDPNKRDIAKEEKPAAPIADKPSQRSMQKSVNDDIFSQVLPKKRTKSAGGHKTIYFERDVLDFLDKYSETYTVSGIVNEIIKEYIRKHNL